MTHPLVEHRPHGGGPGTSALLLVLLATSLVIQCVVLYSPQSPGVSPFPFCDKVVHLVVFAVPAALAVLTGFRPVVVVAVLATHAVFSEVVQAVFLSGRSGDPLDVLADLAGVSIAGAAAALLVRRRGTSRP